MLEPFRKFYSTNVFATGSGVESDRRAVMAGTGTGPWMPPKRRCPNLPFWTMSTASEASPASNPERVVLKIAGGINILEQRLTELKGTGLTLLTSADSRRTGKLASRSRTGQEAVPTESPRLRPAGELANQPTDLAFSGCLVEGPFANLTVNMGPGNHTAYAPHCLRRDFSPWLFAMSLNQSVQDWTMTAPDFWHLDYWIEGLSLSAPGIRIHGGGHFGVGGQIGEVWPPRRAAWAPSRRPRTFLVDHVSRCRTCILRRGIRSFTCTTAAWTGCGGDGSMRVSSHPTTLPRWPGYLERISVAEKLRT